MGAFLFSVDVVASNDVWAVGSFLENDGTLTIHWDGVRWTQIGSPNGGGSDDNVLYGVAAIASNDIWAVGLTGVQSLALHWNGQLWSVVPTPQFSPPNSNAGLIGVVARSSTDVSAVGFYLYASSEQLTLAEHWDGTSWTIQPTPNRNFSNNRLETVTVTPTGTLWSAGVLGIPDKPEQNLVLRKLP